MPKNILIVDNQVELEQKVRGTLLQEFEKSGGTPVVVRAKDGADAALKSANQKFDMVIIDAEAPRLMDGGFIYGIRSLKNTQNASVIVLSVKEAQELPESLRTMKVIKKPVDPDDLMGVLLKVLNGDRQATSTAGKFAVDVRVINAVIKATTKVLEQFGVKDLKMDKAQLRSPQEALLGEVSSVIEIKSSSFHGYMTVSFDKQSYLQIVSEMLMEEQQELTQDNQDAVGEINNIIFGNAKSEISQLGVEMTLPRVLLGQGQKVATPANAAGMMIPFATGKGAFYITVAAFPAAS